MSLLKRIVSVATILTVVLMVAGPAVRPASALTVEELQAQIAALQEQLAAYQQQLQELLGEQGGTTGGTIEGIPEGFTFDRNLKMGMTGDDVKYLQILLNSDPDTKLADEGAGSPGNETTYFGPRTKAAVIKFQEKYADDVLAPWGLTHGTGFVGSTTRAKLNEILASGGGVTPPTPTCSDYTTEEECTAAGCYWYEDACHEEEQPAPTETGLTVTLADDTPAAGVLVDGQGLADLAHFTFTNGDADEVKVTQLKVKRGGVSSDTAISYLYLYNTETGERLTDPVTLSSSYATFNDPTGLFTVPAGESVTVAVKGDIASDVSGQIIQISIESADDISSDATAVNGEFPLTGNQMSVASGDLASVDFNGTTEPSGTPSIDPGETGYTVWKNNVNVSSRSVYLKYLRLKEIGSIDSDDLQNFKLYVNGVEVAGPVQMSDDFYVTFDLTSNPVTLETGTRILEVRADVIDGSGKSFSFSLWYTADIVLEDSQYNVSVIPKKGGDTFTPVTTGTVSINSGQLSVALASDSPSGAVVINGSGVTLAKYTLTAYGEKIKVMSLGVKFDCTDSGGGEVTKLRNGKLYANGVQVGSTQDITKTGVTFNLGSSLIVEPGSPVTLEVKADIYDNDGTNDISANDSLTITLLEGSNNAQRMTSMTLLNVPGSEIAGYTLTVASGNLILVKDSACGDNTTVAGVTGYKLGSYVLTSVSEDVNITQFTVEITTGGPGELTDLSNLYVKYGDNTTSPKTIVSSPSTFTVSYTMPKNTQMKIEIYADISSSAAANATYQTKLTVSGTGAESGEAVTSGEAVDGQTITIGKASLSASLYSGTPDAGLLVAETENVPVAKYKFTAQNADITLKDVYISLVGGEGAENTIIGAKLDLNDDGTPDTPAVYLVDGSSYGYTVKVYPFTGINVNVPKGGDIIITVMLDLNDVTTNGDSGDNVAVKLYAYTYNAGGADQIVQDGHLLPWSDSQNFSAISANDEYVYDGYPVIEYQNLSDTTLTSGTKTLAKFTITAQGDEISWKKIVFSVNANDADSGGDLVLENVKLYKGSTVVAGEYTYDDVSKTGAFVATSEQQIAAGDTVTYYLKADISGVETGDSVLVKIDSGSTTHAAPNTYGSVNADATFVWSDMSAAGHSEETSDWNDDYLIDYIPTDTWALNTSS